MHYLAKGKSNLIYHLTSPSTHEGRMLGNSPHELRKWSVEELENAHKEMHGETSTSVQTK